jgi:hypothetical protein
MPTVIGLATYKEKPNGSLEPYFIENCELKINDVPVLIYKDGVLKVEKTAYKDLKGVKLSPEGENLVLETFAGPIYLKAVKSIQPLESKK